MCRLGRLPGRLVEDDDVERLGLDDAFRDVVAETRIEDSPNGDDEQVLAAVLRSGVESEVQIRTAAD